MGFYEPNDPTNNVKALEEDRVIKIRLQSHQVQVHPTVLQLHDKYAVWEKKQNTNT